MNVLDMFSLKGKVAVVTGGSGLYGKQITRALAEAGATVYNASRNVEKNEVYAKQLRDEGYSVYSESVDLESEESITQLFRRVTAKEPKIDILVNNSVARIVKGYADTTAELYNRSLAINGTALFIITRLFGDLMCAQKSGSIINIGSYMGVLGSDDTLYRDVPGMNVMKAADYFFFKGGMITFSKLTASMYGPSGVRCNVINLGGLFNNQNEKFVARYNERTFLKRMANGTDLMGLIVYLASDASQYMTGASIPLDGGYSAK